VLEGEPYSLDGAVNGEAGGSGLLDHGF
jgi:hypothetical protein